MRAYYFILTFLPISLFTHCDSSIPPIIKRLPEEFTISERYLSFSDTFDIQTELEPLAIARKRYFSLSTTFDLEDLHSIPIATSESQLFTWGTVAQVKTPGGEKIGTIEEEIFPLTAWSKYYIYNYEKKLVAIAQMNFFGTEYLIQDPVANGEIYATIHRPFFRFFRDHWTVQIKNGEVFENLTIDPRLLIVIALYQTEADIRRRAIFESIFRYDLEYYDNRRYE